MAKRHCNLNPHVYCYYITSEYHKGSNSVCPCNTQVLKRSTLFQKIIKTLRDNKRGEYTFKEFDSLMASFGILGHFNQTLEERIIAMLHDAHLPLTFWGEATMAFVKVHNSSPTSALPHHPLLESWYGHKPSISHFRAFGSQWKFDIMLSSYQ